MSGDGGTRFIPPASCSWCGHEPHDDGCRLTIRTTVGSVACPCSRRTKDAA